MPFSQLINRLPTPTLHISSLYHKLFGTPPNYSKLRVFSCLCYPWLQPYSLHKLAPRSTPCVFLGYSLTQSTYICFNPSTTKTYHSRHVRFIESISLHKLAPRSTPCVFLGYSLTQSTYICFNPSTTKTYHSRHVHFIESIFSLYVVNPSLPLMNPLFPHGFQSPSSTRRHLQHPRLWILHPTLSIRSSQAPLP